MADIRDNHRPTRVGPSMTVIDTIPQPSSSMDEPLAVELRGIVKRFPGVVANDGVDFDLRAGEVHALLGENGAGKSTLMNILAGLYRPDEGWMWVGGQSVDFGSPRDAIAAGLGMVHQHFTLVPSQTVTENVLLGLERPRFRLRLQRIRRGDRRPGGHLRLAGRSASQGLAALGRRAAARRDPEDALPRGPRPDHGRADGRARAAGGRRALRDAAHDDRQRPLHRLHQPQARRGAGHRRSRHGHAARQGHCRRAAGGRRDQGGPGPTDGRAGGPRVARSERRSSRVRWSSRCGRSHAQNDKLLPALRGVSLDVRRARSWASPAWRATARASWPRPSPGCDPTPA